MAEALLRRLVAGAARVGSAGFLPPGQPATREAIDTMAARGLDISDHRSRVVDEDLTDGADIIVTMTAFHVAQVTEVAPGAWPRTFSLKDLVRRAEEHPRRDEPVGTWVARLSAGRTPSLDTSDDIADPVGEPIAVYQRTADELAELLRRLDVAAQLSSGSGASGSMP
jgi:protein-tyrosine-phosphatase